MCGIIYGWTGAKKGSKGAARTDDILATMQTQFDAMEPGPKLIMSDLNGSLEAFPTPMAFLREHGWTDIGNDDHKCQGKPGRATCYTKEEAKESRIDIILANSRMTPAIVKCYVDESSDYPTHRPLCIAVLTRLPEVYVKELQRPTNFANMFEQRIEAELVAAAKRKEGEAQKGQRSSPRGTRVRHQEMKPGRAAQRD